MYTPLFQIDSTRFVGSGPLAFTSALQKQGTDGFGVEMT